MTDMETPLSASAIAAGTLLSNSTFSVPPFQREYAWQTEEVVEFWNDLRGALAGDTYFLGLVILTDEKDGSRKQVVDGQQRLLTISLLAAAIHHEAVRAGRPALAERLSADFLFAIDYNTDENSPRVVLSDLRDDQTFQAILDSPEPIDAVVEGDELDPDSLSPRLAEASRVLRERLAEDLRGDPFKKLGEWTDFLTNKVYFAVFVHPDPASAYRVFEVVNTRGRGLTTADLLKNYVLSQTAAAARDDRYRSWTRMARAFENAAPGSFVQFIRHVATVRAGHVPPRDLFDYVTGRLVTPDKSRPPSVDQLMAELERWAPLYLQMIDPTLAGPAEVEWLSVFTALNDLGVISVRPVLMALTTAANPSEGMDEVLRLVVRRIVVGNLGTGNVERRFGEAAKTIAQDGSWEDSLRSFDDLNPARADFVEQLRKRSFNKGTLTFVRRSTVQRSTSPDSVGFLHLVRPRQAPDWDSFPDDEFTYWGSTLGNSLLADVERRPRATGTWDEFTDALLPHAVPGERLDLLDADAWTAETVEDAGAVLAEQAADVWY